MDVCSDLWPTALDGIGERVAATLFSGDGSKMVANDRPDSSQDEPHSAEIIDLSGGPCSHRSYHITICFNLQNFRHRAAMPPTMPPAVTGCPRKSPELRKLSSSPMQARDLFRVQYVRTR